VQHHQQLSQLNASSVQHHQQFTVQDDLSHQGRRAAGDEARNAQIFVLKNDL